MTTVQIHVSKCFDTQIAVHTATQNTDVILAQISKKYLSKESHKHGIIDHERHKKCQEKKWTNREYHVQHNKCVEHQDVRMCCPAKQFPSLKFLGPQNKPHGLRGLGKHYNTRFDTKLVHGTYAIRRVPCAYTFCTYSLDQTWIPSFTEQQQTRYQPIKYSTYWPVLGSFNN